MEEISDILPCGRKQKEMNVNALPRNLSEMPVEIWKIKSLIRIVAETCDPRLKDDEWFRDLAERAGVDLTDADIRNPMVS